MSKRIPVASLAAILNTPPPDMLIEDLIPREGITGVSADPNVGKTWFCLEAARAVVTGTKFLGRFQAKPGAVCFIGQDASVQDYARQVRKLIIEDYRFQQENLDPNDPMDVTDYDDRLKFIIHPGVALVDVRDCEALIDAINGIEHSFTSAVRVDYVVDPETGAVEEVLSEPSRRGVDLIVLDTYASLSGIDNENDNAQTQRIMRHLRAIGQETGAAIMLTHHHPNQTEWNSAPHISHWRGGSAARGALDGHIELHPRRNAKGIISVSIKKFRGIKIDDFEFALVVDEEKAELKARSVEPVTTESTLDNMVYDFIVKADRVIETSEVVDYLCTKMPLTKKDAVRRKVARILDTLNVKGKVARVRRGEWALAKQQPPIEDTDNED